MKKSIILLLFTLVSYAHSSGTVKYTQFCNLVAEDGASAFLKDIYAKANNYSGELNFELKFDSIKSTFVFLGEKSKDVGLIAALSFGKFSENYFDRKNQKYFKNNSTNFIFFEPKEFLITNDLKTNWELINETKVIENKTCYKAKCVDIASDKRNQPKFEVIAWYCPEIPVQLGPLIYGGLPGLILELNFNEFTYVAQKINFEKLKDFNTVKPTGQKTVTEIEYWKLVELKTQEKTEEYEKQTGKKL
jgi:GLPGLI family protein